MINLMPVVAKEDIAYARKNASLLSWAIRSLVIAAALAATVGVGYIYIQKTAQNLQSQVSETKQLIVDRKLESVQKQAEQISGNVKLINQVLKKQILFSKLFRQMGTVMPDGTALTQISVESLQGGIAFTAIAKDAAGASQLQVNLSAPDNKLFDKVDIVGIDCQGGSGGEVSVYPCTVNLKARFVKNSSFYFVNNQAGTSP